MACSKLSVSDLGKVRNEVLSASAKWYDIGLELGITADYLDTIKKANDDPQEYQRELLKYWLSVDPTPSWKALIAALNGPAVKYSALASEIELRKYPSTALESTENDGTLCRSVSSPLPNSMVKTPESQPTTMPEPVDQVLHKQLSAPTSDKPIPKPRRVRSGIRQENQWKHELVQSFQDIVSSQVSQDQIEKAKQCIKFGGTRSERYSLVEFEKLLNKNKSLERDDHLELMTSFDMLFKTMIILLTPNHPLELRSINTANTTFQKRVVCMKGYEDILRIAGYTEQEETSFQFPKHQEPDKPKLSVLAAELLMAKLEVEQMTSATGKQKQETSRDQDSSNLTTCRIIVTDEGSTQGVAMEQFHANFQQVSRLPARQWLSKPKKFKPKEALSVGSQRSARILDQRSRSCDTIEVEEYTHDQYTAQYNGSTFNFINKPSRLLYCQECKNLAYEPHRFRCCNSLFCKQCIGLNTCPICHQVGESVPDDRSAMLIETVMVWCPNSIAAGLGCEWKGKLREVSEHRMECPLEMVSCSYSAVGCMEKMHRNKLKLHERMSRETHLSLSMKEVISMKITIKELQETVEQLKTAFQEFKEQYTIYD